jgi:MtN3 and saliva related transmembrane protein
VGVNREHKIMNTIVINILGFVAAILTTCGFIPQLIKIIKTKSVKDISFEMFAMFLAGVTCWLIYGVLIKSPPVIVANFASMLMNITILVYKLKYE